MFFRGRKISLLNFVDPRSGYAKASLQRVFTGQNSQAVRPADNLQMHGPIRLGQGEIVLGLRHIPSD